MRLQRRRRDARRRVEHHRRELRAARHDRLQAVRAVDQAARRAPAPVGPAAEEGRIAAHPRLGATHGRDFRQGQRPPRPFVLRHGRHRGRRVDEVAPALRRVDLDLAGVGIAARAQRRGDVGVEAQAKGHRRVARVGEGHVAAQPSPAQRDPQRQPEGERPLRRAHGLLPRRDLRRHPGPRLGRRAHVDDPPGAAARQPVHGVVGRGVGRQIDAPAPEVEAVTPDPAGVGEEHPRPVARRELPQRREVGRRADHVDRPAIDQRPEAGDVAAQAGHDLGRRAAGGLPQHHDPLPLSLGEARGWGCGRVGGRRLRGQGHASCIAAGSPGRASPSRR